MKKTLMAVCVVGMLVFGMSVSVLADSDRSVWVKVPFAFHAGDTLMPAGTYQFSMRVKPHEGGSLLRIVNRDGSLCQHVYTNRIEGNPADPDVRVLFNKYGDTYFISKVRGRNLGAEVIKSRAEKELARSTSKPETFANGSPRLKPQRSGK